MTIVSKRSLGFTSSSVYRRKEPHALKYLSERATFWIAVLSVFAFVTGNMVGQHGWHVFWKSVLGEGSDSMVVFTGMVAPVEKIPDYERWGRLGGSVHTHTFRQVPRDLLVALPRYVRHGDDVVSNPDLRRTYFVEHLGTYANGRGKGSHVGEDISLPEGTPVRTVASGIVERVGSDPGGYGTYVLVRHPNVPDIEERGKASTIYSAYAHLSAALVDEGTVVTKGDTIALSGRTGNTSAPHLHFQMDRASAPFHPYWPFTSADLREARLNFTQAINAGLKRENAVQYTLDPMLTVQAFETYVAPVLVADASGVSSAGSSSARSRLTTANRRQMRLAKLTAGKPTCGEPCRTILVAYTEPLPASSAPGLGVIASVRITHDGSFTRDRGWEKVTLLLLDAEGRTVIAPTSKETVYLRTAFGRAEFKPSAVPVASFENGVAHVEMLPLGEQTVVLQAEPLGMLSLPMKYVR